MGGDDISGFFKNSGKPMAIVGLVMILIFRLLDKLIDKGLISPAFDMLFMVFTGLSVTIGISGIFLAFKEQKKEPSSKGGIDPSVVSGDVVVHSEGGNSPAITSGRDTHITYNTPLNEQGTPLVNEKVMARLLKNLEEKDFQLEEKDFQLSDKQKELDGLVEKYVELSLALKMREDTDDFAAKARERLEEGDLEGAEKFLLQSYESNMAVLEEQRKAAAADAYEIAELKVLKLEYREALPYYEQAAKLDPENSKYLNDYGHHLSVLGELKKAIGYLEQALKIDKAVYGDKHSNVARDFSSIGYAWHFLGKLEKAIGYYEQALEIDKFAYGDKHPYVASNLNNIGGVWSSLGNPKKAIGCYEQALEIDIAVYGDKHPNVATRLNNIGGAWHLFGKQEKAIGYFDQALEIVKDVYGDKHSYVASTLNNIGSSWNSLGEPKKALGYFEQALEIDKSSYGEKHPDVAICLNNIGTTWDDLGELRKAKGYYEQALEIFRKAYGDEHFKTMIVYNNLEFIKSELE